MSQSIFIIGHKSPDLDSVAAAIAYADLKNKLENTSKYAPRVAGEINRETKYALEKFGFNAPEILANAASENLILVDHNEAIQSSDGIAEAKILEIIDHHKVDFKYAEPIKVLIEPWGASCSIIFNEFKKNNIAFDKNLAGLMLSAVLVDTVITKSPTCTEIDKTIIEELSRIAEIDDWKNFGMEIFKVRASVSELTAEQIIKSDFKDFNYKSGKVGIGQVETVDLNDFGAREDELMKALVDLKNKEGYQGVILFITDIIQEGSKFFVAIDDLEKMEEALGAKLENGKVYIPGIISRKKQVLPKFSEVFDK
ncbi:MAG: manganese-dependent inorganic pyrophosphatase [Patescibacteria group bacterium]|nr:manganese-dependent inorganic pyrophosphatase [Patescibacteria group bacterium]MDD4610674.1 manganese-dependent inorganic pyrophosphatase [Patescibacteria group bacterium]